MRFKNEVNNLERDKPAWIIFK